MNSGAVGLTIVNGTLIAGGANLFGANVNLNISQGATFSLNQNAQTINLLGGTGTLALTNITLVTGTNNASTSFIGVISGTGGIYKTGKGNLTLAGSNTYSGGTTVTGGGTFSVSSDSNFGAAGTPVTVQEAANSTHSSLAITGSFSTTRNITYNYLSNYSLSYLNVSQGAVFTDNGTIALYDFVNKIGGGKVILDKPVLANTSGGDPYGGLKIDGGTVQNGASNVLPDLNLGLGGGTYDLAGFNQTVGDLYDDGNTGTSIVTNSGGPATLLMNGQNNITFSGNFTGANLSLVFSELGADNLAGNGSPGGSVAITSGNIVLDKHQRIRQPNGNNRRQFRDKPVYGLQWSDLCKSDSDFACRVGDGHAGRAGRHLFRCAHA